MKKLKKINYLNHSQKPKKFNYDWSRGRFYKKWNWKCNNHDFKLVSLGKQTSSETAGIYSCAAFSMIKWYICLVNKVDYTSTISKTLYTFLELG